MGPLGQVVGMIPGLNANMIPKGREKEGTARIKRFLCMMDSMTNEELDGVQQLTDARMVRIARGSGTRPEEVAFLLEEYKKFQKMVEKMGKLKLNDTKDLQQLNRNPKQLMQAMGKAIDPKLL
jgi:signal recognition particle subunit SRP54